MTVSEVSKEYFLIVDDGKMIFPLSKERPNAIGRGSTDHGVTIQIDDDCISRQHCKIEWCFESNAFFISDWKSRPGTFLNGMQLGEKQQVSLGDEIRMGRVVARIALFDDVYQIIRNQESRKADCTLTALNSMLEPIGQVEGLLTLFEYEFDGLTFWHATASVTDEYDQLQTWLKFDQKTNLKVRVELETGESGLAKLVHLRTDTNPPFDTNTVGVTGISPLKKLKQF